MKPLIMSGFDIANTKMYARKLYSRDWLAAHFARLDGTTVLHQMRALDKLNRDKLIALLSASIQIGAATNSIRAAYIRERLARFQYRKAYRKYEAKECPQTIAEGRAA